MDSCKLRIFKCLVLQNTGKREGMIVCNIVSRLSSLGVCFNCHLSTCLPQNIHVLRYHVSQMRPRQKKEPGLVKHISLSGCQSSRLQQNVMFAWWQSRNVDDLTWWIAVLSANYSKWFGKRITKTTDITGMAINNSRWMLLLKTLHSLIYSRCRPTCDKDSIP